MLGCTVSELLERVDSRELTEWMAFEKAFGPLGNDYEKEALATIQDSLNALMFLTGQISYGQKNPVPEPTKFPRPHQAFLERGEEPVLTQAEFDSNF